MALISHLLSAIADRARALRGSRILALGTLLVSSASATLFALGFTGDPHDGPFWLAFLALLWPVFLCPLTCLAVLAFQLFERQQRLGRRIVTLTMAAAATLLPWLPGVITFKPWLSPARALRDSSPIVRARGAEAVGRESGPGVVAALSRALKDPDDDVRLNAAIGLWNQGPTAPEAVPALFEALDDRTYGVRAWATQELARIPGTAPRAVPRLIRALSGPNPDRLDAIEALFWYGRDAAAAVAPLCEVLTRGEPFERRRAARTLGAVGVGARSCIPQLRDQLRHTHEAVRETARATLVSLGEEKDLPRSAVSEWPERTFSSEAWRATPDYIDSHTTNENQRYVFYKDLMRRHLLERKTAAEINELLGSPGTNDCWCLTYHLKSSIASRAGAGPVENENAATWWLEIPLDRDRRAAAVYLKAE